MQTKSNIQIIRENLMRREAFADTIKNLIENYTVKNCYFGISIDENKPAIEYIDGYFTVNQEYSDINEAISNMAPDSIIRIIDNYKFQVGERFKKLSGVKGDNIIDISTGRPVL